MNKSPEEIRKSVETALRRKDSVDQNKAALGGQLQAKKDELATVVKEVRDAGYDPRTLAQTRDKVQAELEEMVANLNKELDVAETAIAALKK